MFLKNLWVEYHYISLYEPPIVVQQHDGLFPTFMIEESVSILRLFKLGMSKVNLHQVNILYFMIFFKLYISLYSW